MKFKIFYITFFFLTVFLLSSKLVNAAEITIDSSVNATNESQKGRTLVWTSQTTGYFFYVDVTTNDLVYVKTTTGGRTWGAIQTVNSGSVTKVSVWYDKWTTGDSGTKIHIAYLEVTTGGANAAMYRDLDTSGDTLGTDTTVNTFGGGAASWVYTASEISLTKARGGNLYIAAAVAAGTHGFFRCTGTCNTGGNWTSRSNVFETSVTDGVILMPGAETDNQDILALYWDYSADEISLKTYDDSGNSFGETSISTGMVENSTYGVQWSAVQRQSDDHVIFAAWNALDSSTADLKVWDVTNSSSITPKTDIITNQAETALVSLMINQSDDTLYAAYMEGNTFTATVDAVYKLSVSGGATWSAQAQFSVTEDDLRWLDAGYSITNETGRFQPIWQNDDLNDMVTSYAYIWDGGGGDNNWNTAGNWLTDTSPSATTDWLVFSSLSSKSATLNTSLDVGGIHILPWYSGTITQSGSNTIDLHDMGFSQNSGVFNGGSGDITLNNSSISDYSIGGGVFNSTSGTMTVGGYFGHAGGTFVQTQGTVLIYPPDGTYFEMSGSPTFNNLSFYADACCNGPMGIGLNAGAITVNGTLSFDNQGSRKDTYLYDVGGKIHAKGNITTLNAGWPGEGVVTIDGTGSQSIVGQTSPAGGDARLPAIEIDKSQGTLTLSDTFRVYASWNYIQGTLVTTGSTVIFEVNDIMPENFYSSGTYTLNNLDIEWGNCCNGRSIEFLSGTATVTGDTNITYDGTPNNSGMYGPGVLNVQGDLNFASGLGLDTGDLGITFSGSADQLVTVNSGNIIPSGTWTINKSSGTVSLATDIDISESSQDLLISSGTLDIAGHNLTVGDEFTINSNGSLKLQGGETISTITAASAGSSVEYNGSGTYSSLAAGNNYSNLRISGSGSFTPASNIVLDGSFTQSAGTFNVAPSGMTISGDFTHSGGVFVPGSSTVTFDNAGNTSSISGTTTFYNFTSIAAGKTLKFASGSNTTVSNALTLRGTSDSSLNLESGDDGYQWFINVNGTNSLNFLHIQDSNACGSSAVPVVATGSQNGGNNSCWTLNGGFIDWYNSSWTKRKKIDIDGSMIVGDQSDFPVLLKLTTDSDLANYAQDDGDDLLITSDDGITKLSHEIEKFDGATGELILWVKVPTLQNGTDQTLYIYYGNNSATNQQDSVNVWDNNFVEVQHFEESALCSDTTTEIFTNSADSTNNFGACANSSSASVAVATGQMGNGRDFTNGTIKINDDVGDFDFNAHTVSFWMKADTIGGVGGNMTDIDDDEDQFYTVSTNKLEHWGNGTTFNTGDNSVNTTDWFNVALTTDSTGNKTIYLNGSAVNTSSGASARTATSFNIGSSWTSGGGANELYDGKLDEVKVSNTNRSASWLQTEYNNQSNPAGYITISSESQIPSTSVRGGVRFSPGTSLHSN